MRVLRAYGIDYSMTCPAVALYDGEEWHIRYLTYVNKHSKFYKFETPIGRMEVAGDLIKEYVTQQERFDYISEWAMSCIDDPDAKIMIEDYAMGAKGKVFHIAENCGLLKHKLWQEGFQFDVLAPTALKKFATGKGNSDKDAMHTQFIKDTGVDLMKEMTPSIKNCSSPVSDVVDAFYLARYAWSKLSAS